MLLDDLVDYLSSQGVSGTIRKGYSEDTPDAEIVLYETEGLSGVHTLGDTPGQGPVERPGIQLRVRDAAREYETARRRAHGVWKLLDSLPGRTINGRRYLYVEAVQSPFLMGRDAGARVLIGCNFLIQAEPSTSSST